MTDEFEEILKEIRNLPEARIAFVKPAASVTDLLGEKGHKRLEEIDEEMGRQHHRLMQYYRFNPENS